jgi:hypothetical protein
VTREVADRWVAKGWAHWRDADTLWVQPGLPLPVKGGAEPASPSTVRFLSKEKP